MNTDNIMKKGSRIFIAGKDDMLIRAFKRVLISLGCDDLIIRTGKDPELTDQAAVGRFFRKERPDVVILTSSVSGGIMENIKRPAEFIYTNLQAECNVIMAAHENKAKKLVFLASSCAYPKNAAQPMKEGCLLSGKPEPTSEAFAVAKIAGIKLCEYFNRQYKKSFFSVVPATAFGPYDDFDENSSHVMPGLMRRMHLAVKSKRPDVTIWGSGKPRREFIYADDLAGACLFLLSLKRPPCLVNVGTGKDVSVRELARLLKEKSGYGGSLIFDKKKPDGAPRKLLDVSLLRSLGWRSRYSLEEGIERTYEWMRRKYAL
jgi:GDP-L-fucose synthase